MAYSEISSSGQGENEFGFSAADLNAAAKGVLHVKGRAAIDMLKAKVNGDTDQVISQRDHVLRLGVAYRELRTAANELEEQ